MRHQRFEWDERKARANVAKHGIAFEEAAAVLADPFAEQTHITMFDEPHSEHEDRWKTLGSYPFDRNKIFLVVWTTRMDADGSNVTRIISARPLTPRERKEYKDETSDFQDRSI